MRDIVKHKREAKTIKQYEATIITPVRRRPPATLWAAPRSFGTAQDDRGQNKRRGGAQSFARRPVR